KLPCIVAIEFEVVPTPLRQTRMICLLVISKGQIAIQQIGYGVTGFGSVSCDKARRITTAATAQLLILDVPTVKTTKLEVMISPPPGEVILPTPQILIVNPWAFLPDVVVAAAIPHQTGNIWALRKHGWKLRGDIRHQRLRLWGGVDEDVVARLRKLKVINR